jgi:RHS repeat-associated protein
VSGTVVHRRTLVANGTETTALEYRHRDHLGSVSAVTNASGTVQVKPAFEPFGARRKSDWTGDLISPAGVLMGLGSTTDRGFTDHEHLDRTGFVHMNGRVFDPRIGRFVQPDPIVQAPFFSQSYNRYAYVFNSPLSFTDPSGFCGAELGGTAGESYGTATCVYGMWERGVPPSMVDFPAGYRPNMTPPSAPAHRVADCVGGGAGGGASCFNVADGSGSGVTLVVRPLQYTSRFNHASLFVVDPATGEILRQYSLQGGATRFDPQLSPLEEGQIASGTYQADRRAFLSPSEQDQHFAIGPPAGVSAADFRKRVIQLGDGYRAVRYSNLRGPNSNSAAAFPLYRAGAEVPNVPRTPFLHYYRLESE